MVRLAVVSLSLAVVVAAAAAVTQAVTPRPVPAAGVTVAQLEDARSTSDGAMRAAGDSAAADSPEGSFTLAELDEGAVSVARFTALWDAELERLRTAPCPAPSTPGATVVVVTVGATPPAHLGDDYPDYAPLLAEARAAAAAACG